MMQRGHNGSLVNLGDNINMDEDKSFFFVLIKIEQRSII